MSRSKTIAIVSEKGGAGKTIISVNLAVAAENHGLMTTVFDLDPRANSTVWGDARNPPPKPGQERTEPIRPPEVTPAQAVRLPLLLSKAREQGVDLIIIDTPGNAPELGDAAAAEADAILIPCRPDGPDLISIAVSVKRMQAAGKPLFVVINAAPAQGTETIEAIAAIGAAGVEVCPIVLQQRKPFKQRFHEGLTANDFDPKGKAAAEINALLLWICEKVGMLPSELVTEPTKQLA